MKRIVYSIVAAALALTACTKEYENTYILPEEEVTGTYDQMSVSLPEQTRTYLDGNKVCWEAGDEITAWSSFASTPITFSLTGDNAITNGGKKAKFTVGQGQGVKFKEDEPTTFYAVYPASSNKTISIPQNQSWNGVKNFYQNVNPMIAKGTDFDNMTFQNPCAILAFKLAAKEGNTAYLNRIEVSSQTARLSGTATVNWSDLSLQWTSVNYNVTLQGGGSVIPVGKENAGVYYIVIPAGDYNDFTIKVVYRSNKGREFSRTRYVDKAMEIKAGQIFSFNTVFELETVDPKAPETYKVGDVYPKEGTPQGVVFEVAADGLSGKIVALEDCGGNNATYLWGTASISNSPSDGLSNTNELTESPAAKACIALRTTDGPQWYLPARDELTQLCDMLGIVSRVADFKELLGTLYWSSTMTGSSASNFGVYCFDMDNFEMSRLRLSTLTNTQGSVRAIAQFESK